MRTLLYKFKEQGKWQSNLWAIKGGILNDRERTLLKYTLLFMYCCRQEIVDKEKQ